MTTWRWKAPLIALCLARSMGMADAAGGGTGTDSPSPGANQLVAVLRETMGENRPVEQLEPWGTVTIALEDGREVDVEPSWYHYLGDMHIRLVFDGPQALQSATPDDLARMHLDAPQALQVAADNLRRMYGNPQVSAWDGGLMRVAGRANDFNSSYFLDRDLWLGLQREHPQGLVAAVPQRGGLVFAPADDAQAVDRLRFGAVALYAGARGQRVSSALYLFKDGRWSVFQPPMAR